MKKIIATILILVLCVSLFAGCGASSAPAAPAAPAQSNGTPSAPAAPDAPKADDSKPVTLVFGHGMNSATLKPQIWQEKADQINELSGGTVTVDMQGDGTLVGDDGQLDAVMTGVTQFGTVPFTYLNGMIPEVAPLCLPGWFTGDRDAFMAFDQEIFDVMTRIFEKYGLKYIAGDYPSQSALFGNGPIATTPDALKGTIVRTSGAVQTAAIEAWGGAGTVIGLGDLTTALERGTVDSAFSGFVLIHAFSFDEVCDWAVMLPSLEPGHCFFMSQEGWNSLSASQQDAIMEAYSDITPYTWDRCTAEEYEPYVAEYRQSMEVAELTPEEFAPFTELLKPMFEQYKENNSPEGIELLQIIYKYNNWDW